MGTDRFDFVADLGAELPMRVIGMLLGIPESEQPAVRDRSDAVLRTEAGKPMAVRQEAIANGRRYAEYVDWRVDHPSDDLMTALLNAEFEDETGVTRRLTRDEVLTYTQVLAGAGNETTGRLIGWLGKVLGDHPDQRRQLAADPSLIPNTVEETLRFEPTGPHLARYVARDVEYYGTTVPAGSAILLLVGSANRDERRYDDPDRFDVHRDNSQHLTFGYGLHFCLGAALARLEGRVALDEVLKRFPDWEVDYEQRPGRARPRRCAAGTRCRCSSAEPLEPPPVAQLALEDLAGRVAGQGVDEGDVLRHLELGQLGAAVLDAARRRSRSRPSRSDDERHRHLAPPLVGAADHRHLEHRLVLVEHPLDLGAGDVLAARHDHVLEPVDDEEVAVVVAHADVAGVEPAAGERLARWPRDRASSP